MSISIVFIEDVGDIKAGESRSLTRYAALDLIRKGKARLTGDEPVAKEVKPPKTKPESAPKNKSTKPKK